MPGEAVLKEVGCICEFTENLTFSRNHHKPTWYRQALKVRLTREFGIELLLMSKFSLKPNLK